MGGNLRILLQPLPDKTVEELADRGGFDAVEDLAGEGMDQHAAGTLGPDAAGAEVLTQVPAAGSPQLAPARQSGMSNQ